MSRIDHWVRVGQRRLWRGFGGSLAEVSRRQRDAHLRAVTIVRVFYGLCVLWIIEVGGGWHRLLDSEVIHPAWPASWIDGNDPRGGIAFVLGAVLVSAVWAAIAPQVRWARIAFAVSFLQYIAIVNGFGKIVHNLHAPLYVSIALIFLPRRPWERATTVAARQHFLTVVWMAQSLLLFAYGMTGFWKVAYALNDVVRPQLSMLSLDGFSLMLATRIAITEQSPVLGDAVIDRPWLGWLLFVGTMYLETASFLVIFRPRVHRFWGFGLIAFHIGTQLLMGFTFTQNIALLVLFLVVSPLTVQQATPREVFGDLPGVLELRWLIRRLRRRRAPEEASVAPA